MTTYFKGKREGTFTDKAKKASSVGELAPTYGHWCQFNTSRNPQCGMP